MNASGEQRPPGEPDPIVTQEIAAEAAVWIARLHGPDRSARMERECLEWQARSAAHRLAFEKCTDVWEAVPRVRLADAYASASSGAATPALAQADRSARWRYALAPTLLVLVGSVSLALHFWPDGDVYATKVGEQQLVVLGDGTRMSLNTDSRARVEIDAKLRTVSVERGEILFEVAKDLQRPFVVRAGDSEVVALGTVFSVRLGDSAAPTGYGLAVTLIEGQVTVRAASADAANGLAPTRPLLMQAGQRVHLHRQDATVGQPAVQQLDQPRIEQLMAWKRNEAIFDDVALPDALAEMNRYSRTPIVLVGAASLSQLRVSGLYRTGDSASFARAVAALHSLVLRERGGRLELASPQ